MQAIAKFEKVSFAQFEKDIHTHFSFMDLSHQDILHGYEQISMPKRATKGAAGYDISCPFQVTLTPSQSITIPTGLRCNIASGWVLMIFPRSGLGFRYGLQLDNTAGVIDSDYYEADNQGHIMVKIHYQQQDTPQLVLDAGSRFSQGLFLPFGICENDMTFEKRTGGFGSTGQKA